MKKSVILLIGIVYLASVLIVGLMGLEMRIYAPVTYVSEIVYVPQGTKADSSNEKRDVFKKNNGIGFNSEIVYKEKNNNYEVGDVAIRESYVEGLTIELKFDIKPANATNKGLDFYFSDNPFYRINGEIVTDKTQKPKEGDTEEGWIIYTKNADGNAVLTFKKTGNSTARATIITISPMNAQNPKRNVKITIDFSK